ncbi:MAG TPA: hypothetical protein VJ729_06785 [Nitrososphaeraceae archaeon]|nr:hypothetical protein [Nitrososphaeraceae archaeon]
MYNYVAGNKLAILINYNIPSTADITMQIHRGTNIGISIMFIGVLILILNVLSYQSFQPLVITDENSIWMQRASYLFYVLLFSGIALLAIGIHKTIFKIQYDNNNDNMMDSYSTLYPSLSFSGRSLLYSLSKIIITIVTDKKYFRFFWPTAIGYGIFYALISGMLIYRSETFSSLYGISTPSITMITYGPMGYVPTMAAYFTQHMGILIIPINLFITLIVAALVGFNAVLSIYAFTNRPRKYINNNNNNTNNNRTNSKATSFLSVLGATTSLFAACPTCASFYIFSIMAGSLAPTIAAFTVNFYALFFSLSIPLLIFTPFLTALNIRKMLYGQCSLGK